MYTDIAEIVLNKSMRIHDTEGGQSCVTFSYEFVEDFENHQKSNKEGDSESLITSFTN